jgi:hypothetical protein
MKSNVIFPVIGSFILDMAFIMGVRAVSIGLAQSAGGYEAALDNFCTKIVKTFVAVHKADWLREYTTCKQDLAAIVKEAP